MAFLNEVFPTYGVDTTNSYDTKPLSSEQKLFMDNEMCNRCGKFTKRLKIGKFSIKLCTGCGYCVCFNPSNPFMCPSINPCFQCGNRSFITSNDGNRTQTCTKCHFKVHYD